MTFETLKELNSGGGSTLGDYKFLYGFISLIRPKKIVEVGTHLGLSAIAMAMALRDEGLTESKIISIDISPKYLEIAKKQLGMAGLSEYVTLVHGDSSVVENYQPFDVAFIDAEHTYVDFMRDFDNVKNHAMYILVHDIQNNDRVGRAVKTIADTMKYDVFNLDIGAPGEQWSLNKVVYTSYPGFAIIRKRHRQKIGISFLDTYAAQTWSAIDILNKFFSENHDIKRVVELGTGAGGLTLLFGINMISRNGKVLSLDIRPGIGGQTQKTFKTLNITYEQRDVFEEDTVERVKKFIGEEQALIFCDNGDKHREFPLYTKILKRGDFIMAHDWEIEITQAHLDEQKEILSVLEPYLQEDFDAAETYILSMKRI